MPAFEFFDMTIADPSEHEPGIIRVTMGIAYPLADGSGAETLTATIAQTHNLNRSIADIRFTARERLKELLKAALTDAGG